MRYQTSSISRNTKPVAADTVNRARAAVRASGISADHVGGPTPGPLLRALAASGD